MIPGLVPYVLKNGDVIQLLEVPGPQIHADPNFRLTSGIAESTVQMVAGDFDPPPPAWEPGTLTNPEAAGWETLPGVDFQAEPGQQIRFLYGENSGGPQTTAPTGRVRVQRWNRNLTPPPPPLEPVLIGLSLSTTTVEFGGKLTGTVKRGAASSKALAVQVIWNPQGLTMPILVTIPPGLSSASFPITGLESGNYTVRATDGTQTFTAPLTVTPKVGPGPAELADLSVPATVGSGQSVTGLVTLSGLNMQTTTAPVGLSSDRTEVMVPSNALVAPGQATAPFSLTAEAGILAQLPVVITAQRGSVIRTAQITVQPRLGPGRTLNVMDYGAVGNGLAEDIGAFRRAMQVAGRNDTIYMPAGTYNCKGTPEWSGGGQFGWTNKSGVTLAGAGKGATKLLFGTGEGIWLRPAGLADNTLRDFTIQGAGRAIAVENSQQCRIQNVDFDSVGIAYAAVRGEGFDTGHGFWNVLVEYCDVRNGVGHGFMVHGGEVIRHCSFFHAPSALAGSFGHPFYIANAMQGAWIEDITLGAVGGHCIQIYADSSHIDGTEAQNISIKRVTVADPYHGVVLAANGLHKNILFEDIRVGRVRGTDAGSVVISATNGDIDNLVMRRVTLEGGDLGLVLQGGVGPMIKNSIFEGFSIRNHNRAVFVNPPGWPGGRYANDQIIAPEFANVGNTGLAGLPAGINLG